MKIDEYVKGLPAYYLTAAELNDLPEYSCSMPTGTTIGRMWKKDMYAYDPDNRHLSPTWVICQYVEHPNPNKVGIKYYQARLKGQRIKALV